MRKENKIRHRLAVGKDGENSPPRKLNFFLGGKVGEMFQWDWVWKTFIALTIYFGFLLVILTLDE